MSDILYELKMSPGGGLIARGRVAAPVRPRTKASAEAFAGLADQRHGLGEEDADRVADLHRLLVGVAGEVEAVDRGDGHLDRQLDRVVGPGDPLRGLHLLGELLHAGTELVGIAEKIERAALHVPMKADRAPRLGRRSGWRDW